MKEILSIDDIIKIAIKEKMKGKKSPKIIRNEINKDHNRQYSIDDIIDIIREYFDMEWEKENRKYHKIALNNQPVQKTPLEQIADENTSASQMSNTSDVSQGNNEAKPVQLNDNTSNLLSKPKPSSELPEHRPPIEASDINNHPENKGIYNDPKNTTIPPSPNPSNPCLPILDKILNLQLAMQKSIGTLEESNRSLNRKISDLEKTILEIKEDSPYQRVHKTADELIDIYANEKSKKNININSKINDKIINIMQKKYRILNNNSHAINTALILALYKSGLEQLPDKK